MRLASVILEISQILKSARKDLTALFKTPKYPLFQEYLLTRITFPPFNSFGWRDKCLGDKRRNPATSPCEPHAKEPLFGSWHFDWLSQVLAQNEKWPRDDDPKKKASSTFPPFVPDPLFCRYFSPGKTFCFLTIKSFVIGQQNFCLLNVDGRLKRYISNASLQSDFDFYCWVLSTTEMGSKFDFGLSFFFLLVFLSREKQNRSITHFSTESGFGEGTDKKCVWHCWETSSVQ